MSDYPPKPILIVDDEPHILTGFSGELKFNGITNILACANGAKVMGILEKTPVSMIFLDLIMPGIPGQELLEEIHQKHPDIPVVVVTASDEVNIAVHCMKCGARDFLTKPLEPGRLASVCRNTLEYREMNNEINRLSANLLGKEKSPLDAFDSIITLNRDMHGIFRYILSVAESSQPLFITGETGTGKDLIARAAHNLSGRQGDYVKINAAGLDDNMFADTLFGHARGAYTGAETPRGGMVEKANGGTLFLDEIGELSPLSQVKLLGLIQEREYMRIGEDKIRFSGARIIAATNRDINLLQQSTTFRRDLYFRFMTHHVHLPPLRQRREDIPPLVEYFIKKAAISLDREPPLCPSAILNRLKTYHFPGNIRELEAMIFDAVSISTEKKLAWEVFQKHMEPTPLHAPKGSSPSKEPVRREAVHQGGYFEKIEELPTLKEAAEHLVQEALNRAKGNQAKAARMLGISRQALNKRLKPD